MNAYRVLLYYETQETPKKQEERQKKEKVEERKKDPKNLKISINKKRKVGNGRRNKHSHS
jgi:hypothetical protein